MVKILFILSKRNFEAMFKILPSRRTFKTPRMKVGSKISFWLGYYFQNFISCARTKKNCFYWEKNDIVLLLTSHGTGLAAKTWKRLSSVQNETRYYTTIYQGKQHDLRHQKRVSLQQSTVVPLEFDQLQLRTTNDKQLNEQCTNDKTYIHTSS